MKICFNGQQQYVLFLLLFQPIERVAKKFNPLHIPKKLQRDLPFKSKPKNELKQKKKTYEQKRAVIMETDEKKVSEYLRTTLLLGKIWRRTLDIHAKGCILLNFM